MLKKLLQVIPILNSPDASDIPENNKYECDSAADILHKKSKKLQGIQWIKSLPNLQQAPHEFFTAAEAEDHIKKAIKISSDVNAKFKPKYTGAFCSEAMGKWAS